MLNTQRHNTIHDIIVILLERLDGLFATDARLRHHELDIFTLQTGVVDFLAVVVFVVFGRLVVYGFAFAFVRGGGGVGGVVRGGGIVGAVGEGVDCCAGGGGFLGGELLSGRGLLLRVEVFDLGFAEDDVGVAVGRLVHVWVADHEQDLEGQESVFCLSVCFLRVTLSPRF